MKKNTIGGGGMVEESSVTPSNMSFLNEVTKEDRDDFEDEEEAEV
jgi:hypothetical protein